MTFKASVFLVDDDPSIIDALKVFLEISGFPVRAYPSATAFLDDYQESWPGCLLLDIGMPGMNGLELQQCLLEKNFKIPIIFLTGHGNVPQACKAFKAGAVDFVEKPFNEDKLLASIREAFEIDRQQRLMNRQVQEADDRFKRLTRREKEVFQYIVSGLSNKEIARQLNISHRTIDVHRARVMEKMKANSLAELVTMASIFNKIS